MKNIIILTLCLAVYHAKGQGCVAIRSNGHSCTMLNHGNDNPAKWQVGFNTRFFTSYKHFVGSVEQKQRVADKSEVINRNFSTDLTLGKALEKGWSCSFYLPLIHNLRSSKYEHYGNSSTAANARRTTSSIGMGDVRLAIYKFLLKEKKALQLQLGLGLKLPTGDYRYSDYFWKNDSTKILGPVDQSIQLGDGGTGATVELNASQKLSEKLSCYFNGFYLMNPREHNGVSTARGGATSVAQVSYGSDVMSVADQYMSRAGMSVQFEKFSVSLGGRVEGIPAQDIIGGSNGFRRPGYVVSLEPLLIWNTALSQFYVSVPWAVHRNRIQSVPDKIRSQKTGIVFKGDAAFADYSVNLGYAFKLH